MNYEDVLKLDEASRSQKVDELRAELFNIKFSKSTTGIEKPHEMKEIKKTIARLKTANNVKGN